MKNNSISGWFQGIKGRLLLAAFLPLIGIGIIFGVAFNGLNKTNVILNTAHESIIPNFAAIGEMRQSRNKFSSKILEATLHGQKPDERAAFLKSAREGIKEFSDNYVAYTKAPFLPGEEVIHDKVKAEIPEFIKTMETIATLMEANDPEKTKQAGDLLEGPFAKIGAHVRDFNRAVADLYDKTAEAQALEAKATQKEVFNMMLLITAISAVAIFGVLLWIASKISHSVGSIADRLTGASTQVATAVEQLNEAGNSLSHSSTEAAASLEETVAALEELTSMVQMNSDNAKQAAALSASSRDAAETGENEIKNLITSMTEISRSSKKIEEIISVIDDIAFQTNLLALNAAVEAARAGEQGKGFAVVAEAVRTLAQRSAASAKDINSLIKESVSQIDRGSEIADQSGTVLSNIVNSIKKVSDLNNEIAAASSEQTTGIQQISKAMNQLDQSSQSNAASAEEIAATSGEISNLAVNTMNLTVELNTVVLGGDTGRSAPPAETTLKTNKPTPKTASKKTNVIPMRKAASVVAEKNVKSAEAIPFDEDDRAKVGNTDGF
ncbi:HAMP domain-containing methyl-accepting chemotaxis protein [Bdellovibrio svalbardensis]|uniref:Methyl-accepting chemotaxis protein n=1 Tax=Bdellovibrio svalbardensis TaxID=2972972 RepID=A0ABT6DL21_9BACT|nr:methyl-accepting chemotaxis protein [Bdellovibrio svalbardensis]MDG0817560.1 methyl-accepting chemotaxis protein [Bdellovibrio svalbardensis]